jgi:hypothetical protein
MAKMAHLAAWVPWALAELLAQEVSPVQEDSLGLQDPSALKAHLVREESAASRATRATEERSVQLASPEKSVPPVLEVLSGSPVTLACLALVVPLVLRAPAVLLVPEVIPVPGAATVTQGMRAVPAKLVPRALSVLPVFPVQSVSPEKLAP